ncbi:SRPBCC family protein [Candidatus Uabimicrobium sp. HlEnr_7]|uniref:aromatic ring-hydroxylating oxygenase subunit alpha n=1 Tax=Candidatus Uabimicrobium helgolandensis TaxID=3095367 RepID=UPI003557E42A
MIEQKALSNHPELKETFNNLLQRLEQRISQKTTDMGEKPFTIPVTHYTDPSRFEKEQKLLRNKLTALGAASLVIEPGQFFTVTPYKMPLIVTRDKENKVRVFANVCSHRGAILKQEKQGCSNAFICPYHSWSYNLNGELLNIPGMKTGMPNCDKKSLALREYPCIIRAGIVWTILDNNNTIDTTFDALANELDHLLLDDFQFFHESVYYGDFNWKLGVESFLEVYHFSYAHGKTLPNLKYRNICLIDSFADHGRIVVPINSLEEQMKNIPRSDWEFLQHVNVMYFIFPGNFLLVFDDHFAWINIEPISQQKTKLTCTTLVPAKYEEEKKQKFQRISMGLEMITKEDYELCATIQKGLAGKSLDNFSYTCFEEMILRFHNSIDNSLQ